MSVEKLVFKSNCGQVKIEWKNEELRLISEATGYDLALDRNEAHLLMLYLQEKLK